MQWSAKTNNAGFMNFDTNGNKKPWLPVNENYVFLNVEVEILKEKKIKRNFIFYILERNQ